MAFPPSSEDRRVFPDDVEAPTQSITSNQMLDWQWNKGSHGPIEEDIAMDMYFGTIRANPARLKHETGRALERVSRGPGRTCTKSQGREVAGSSFPVTSFRSPLQGSAALETLGRMFSQPVIVVWHVEVPAGDEASARVARPSRPETRRTRRDWLVRTVLASIALQMSLWARRALEGRPSAIWPSSC